MRSLKVKINYRVLQYSYSKLCNDYKIIWLKITYIMIPFLNIETNLIICCS